MKEQIRALKALVLTRASESRAQTNARLELKASSADKQSGDYLDSMWKIGNERYQARWNGRVAHLAYGFARGVPYDVMEAKTHDDFIYFLRQSVTRCLKDLGFEVEEEQVRDWIESTSTEAEAAE